MREDQVYPVEADTLLLQEAAEEEVKDGDRILELGTGSGCIACSLQRFGDVVATDINPHAVAMARRRGLEVIRADLCTCIRGLFDLIIFNPPYLPTTPEERVDDWLEAALDGGRTGRSVIERFAIGVAGILSPGGRILLLVSSLSGLSAVIRIFTEEGLFCQVVKVLDLEDEQLYVIKITRYPEHSPLPG
jgi:release factor glutamine methyltransferase